MSIRGTWPHNCNTGMGKPIGVLVYTPVFCAVGVYPCLSVGSKLQSMEEKNKGLFGSKIVMSSESSHVLPPVCFLYTKWNTLLVVTVKKLD